MRLTDLMRNDALSLIYMSQIPSPSNMTGDFLIYSTSSPEIYLNIWLIHVNGGSIQVERGITQERRVGISQFEIGELEFFYVILTKTVD